MQQYRKNLGKVSLTAEGAWDGTKGYDILSIVYDEHTQHGFISRQAVPEGVDLYNKEYWMPFNVSGYADNNVIILSKKTAEHTIQSYTLEEAIASIKSVGRRPGAILGFYNENADRLDIGGRWELWQFNDTNVYNWDNIDSWQNLYYNYNKFMGWYQSEEHLKKYAPFPEIGCYAFVGSEFNEATVYRCDSKYIWRNTTQHAWDYVKVIVDGNVTVGENGNWFNNGEDTGIPASVKGENGKTPVFREKDNTIQYSFDNVNWITISDKVAAWFRWNATTGDTQANNVGRIQISRDNVIWTNLSGDIINNLHISRYIGADESLPTSGIAEGTIYAKGPTYADEDTSHNNPIYRLWVYAWKDNTLAWQDNGEFTSIAAGVVQETGDSETEVMSQKAVTEKLSKLLKNNLVKTNIQGIYNLDVNKTVDIVTFQSYSRDGIIRIVGYCEGVKDLFFQAYTDTGRLQQNIRVEGDFDTTFNYDDLNINESSIVNKLTLQITSINTGGVLEINNIYASQNIVQGLLCADNTEKINYIDNVLLGESIQYKTAIVINYILQGDGNLRGFTNYNTSVLLPINTEYRYISFEGLYALDINKTFCGLALYDSDENLINVFGIEGIIDLNDYPTASLLRYCIKSGTNFNIIGSKIVPPKYEKKYVTQSVGNILGYKDNQSSEAFGERDYKYIVTTANSQTDTSGIIKEIIVRCKGSGKIRFVVGLLDQRNKVVVSQEFDADVISGINQLDIEDMNIAIAEGEQLFAYIGYYGDAIITWEQNNTLIANEMIYGDINSEINRLPTKYGGYVTLAYTVLQIHSIFAQKSELKSQQSQISEIRTDVQKMGIVYDNEGNPYKLKVYNGTLIPISMNYKKVVALGNSLTAHEIAENIGYYGDGWAMAASVKENSWTYLLEEVLKQKRSDAVVVPYNIYSWEIDYLNVNLSELLDDVLTSDTDLIIFRAGENGSNTDNYDIGVDRIISYIINKCPSATIVMTSLFWHKDAKESAIKSVADKYGLSYIYTEAVGSNRYRIGDYTQGVDGLLYPIINSGVAQHMNDVGFAEWTNILANAFGYSPLNYIHNVSIVDSSNIGYTAFNKWVYRGVFSIHTSANNVSAISGDEELIVTNQGEGVWTFFMPNSDVTVTIS